VFTLTLLVASIALADSLNPSTELPALYLATTPHAVRKIAAFALGVFLVSFTFGVVVVVGPGQLVLGAVQHVGATAKHAVEALVGAVLILTAIALWRGGQRLTDRIPTGSSMRGRSALALGAAIMVVELPTALPYFAALAAIVGSDVNLTEQIVMVLVFNVIFLLPVLAILALRMAAGERAEQRIEAVGKWTRRYATTVVASLAGVAGLAFLIVGIAGLR
jgi:cytochrome c biogenesis protein CcdA